MRFSIFHKILVVVAGLVTMTAASAAAIDWITQTSGTTYDLDDVWFISPSEGWIVGDIGTSLRTTDGGQTWQQIFLTGQDLAGVTFADASVGLIVGDNGLILRTTNGGLNWGAVSSGTDVNLEDVAFGDGGLAYVAGRDGVLLRSDDGGASWTVAETGTVRYRGIWAEGTSAWAVGEDGVIRATSDGGLNWVTQNSGTGSDLKGVMFVSELEGWASGQNSTVIHTSDGGLTWTPRSTGILVGVDGIFFVDASTGWAIGNQGSVFHSTSGGLAWGTENSNTTNELDAVHFADPGHGWAVGEGGTIIHRLDPVSAVDVPEAMVTLHHSVPNPFNPSTEIRFDLARSTAITLAVHDTRGREVRGLAGGNHPAGSHTVMWDGTDESGRPLPSGIYFVHLRGAGSALTQKIVLAK
jgi:photosystem II stability/assembly factor-like uncharacterized protein